MPTSTRRKTQDASSPKPESTHQEPSSGTTVTDLEIQVGGGAYVAAMNAKDVSESRKDSAQSPMSTPQKGARSSSSPDTIAGFQSVGDYMHELMDTMRKLEQLGVERSNIPVPKIVVTGDQSAGKSSFIEAISQISVPRNVGTCTRCPVQITTSSSDALWKCTVKLVHKYQYFDKKFLATQGDCYVPGTFHPWQESSQTDIFDFASLTDPAQVCETIERAQAAILHPSQNPAKFQHGALSTSDKGEVKFSPNYISLEISGPNLPNLSFYDLPGVISRTRNPDEAYLVHLVENLVREYIDEDSAIVLLAIALEQDQEHSRTSRLIEEAGAKGRCVGVLTKPDRLAVGTPTGDLDKILSGQDLPLGHGYYVTKQPDQSQRDLTHSDARSLEEVFFTRQAPWATELAHHQALFGTKKIQNALSKLLFDQITALLPEIREKLASKLQLIDEELATLPEVPTQEVIHIVSSCLNAFAGEVQAFIRGRYPDNEFRVQWRNEKDQLRKRMQALRPRLTLHLFRDAFDAAQLLKKSPTKSKPVVHMDLTDDSEVGTPAPMSAPVTPRKRGPDDPFTTPLSSRSVKKQNRSSEHEHEVFQLDEMRAFLDGYSAVGLQDSYDPEAVEKLILKSLRWEQPAKDLLAGAQRCLSEALTTAITKCLHAYTKTPFYTAVQRSVKDFVVERVECYQAHAGMLLKHEQHQPSSLDTEAIRSAQITVKEELEDARFKARAKTYLEMQAKNNGKTDGKTDGKTVDTAQLLASAKDKQTLSTLLGPDSAEREIDVMSRIRGYYSVASIRFADNLYRAVEVELFEALKVGLKQHLDRDILYRQPNVQDHCAELLAEDPVRERRRIHLKQERTHLQAASQMLDDLAQRYGAGVPDVDEDEIMC